MLYVFFWVIPRRLNFICRRFGTLCPYHLHRPVGVEWINFILHLPAYEDGTSAYEIQMPGNYPKENIQHIQSPVHCYFLPEVMTRYQKISHIDYNLTLSKTFNFEDAYHLKISQSSDHYWKRDYIVGHLTQDYSDVGQLTSEYGHEKMMLCH